MDLHHAPHVIAADYARSEALGAQLLADLAAGVPAQPSVPSTRYFTYQLRRTNLATGEQTTHTVTEAA